MAHNKMYGVCENKCLVETISKAQYEADKKAEDAKDTAHGEDIAGLKTRMSSAEGKNTEQDTKIASNTKGIISDMELSTDENNNLNLSLINGFGKLSKSTKLPGSGVSIAKANVKVFTTKIRTPAFSGAISTHHGASNSRSHHIPEGISSFTTEKSLKYSYDRKQFVDYEYGGSYIKENYMRGFCSDIVTNFIDTAGFAQINAFLQSLVGTTIIECNSSDITITMPTQLRIGLGKIVLRENNTGENEYHLNFGDVETLVDAVIGADGKITSISNFNSPSEQNVSFISSSWDDLGKTASWDEQELTVYVGVPDVLTHSFNALDFTINP